MSNILYFVHNFLRVGRKFLIGGISLCKGSTIIPAISEFSSAKIFSMNSMSLKGATKTSDVRYCLWKIT